MTTIYIVDDTEEVLKSLHWLIEPMGYCVKSFSDAEEFLEQLNIDDPGCIILDIRMPKISGLELQNIFIQREIMLPIIFITGHGDVPMAVEAMQKGAIDFIQKPINNQKLLDAINQGLRENTKLRKQAAKQTLILENIKQLTKREQEITALLVKGSTSKIIAQQLNISPHTVEIHRGNILKKMQCKNMIGLVNLLMTNGCLKSLHFQMPSDQSH